MSGQRSYSSVRGTTDLIMLRDERLIIPETSTGFSKIRHPIEINETKQIVAVRTRRGQLIEELNN